MNTLNLNVDQKTLEACLKTVKNIGSTTYRNICTDQSVVVNWGAQDWLAGITVSLVAVLMIVVLLGAVAIVFYVIIAGLFGFDT